VNAFGCFVSGTYKSGDTRGAACLHAVFNITVLIVTAYAAAGATPCSSYHQIQPSPHCLNLYIALQVTAAVVTCGGLCPGLNDVIQNIIVFTLEDYGVPPDQIFGIRYGLRGFYDREFKPINLNKKTVQNIHLQGGTMLVSFDPNLCVITINFDLETLSLSPLVAPAVLHVDTHVCRPDRDALCRQVVRSLAPEDVFEGILC